MADDDSSTTTLGPTVAFRKTTISNNNSNVHYHAADEEDVLSVDLLDDMGENGSNDDDEEQHNKRPHPKQQQLKETPPSHSTKTTISPVVFSPATQTLNVLSQNMQDLRYETALGDSEQQQQDQQQQQRRRYETTKITLKKKKEDNHHHDDNNGESDHKKDTTVQRSSNSSSKSQDRNPNASSCTSSNLSLSSRRPQKSQPPPRVIAAASKSFSSTTSTNTAMVPSSSKRKAGVVQWDDMSTTTTMTKATKSPFLHVSEDGRIPWNDLQQDWELRPIKISDTTGKLGIVIARVDFAKNFNLDGTRNNDDDDDDDRTGGKAKSTDTTTMFINAHTMSEPNHCKILRVIDQSLGKLYGIQAGDWICHPSQREHDDDEDTSASIPIPDHVVLAPFSLVQEWSKKRPFCVTILRSRSQSHNPRGLPPHLQRATTKMATAKDPPGDATETTKQIRKVSPHDPSRRPLKDNDDDDDRLKNRALSHPVTPVHAAVHSNKRKDPPHETTTTDRMSCLGRTKNHQGMETSTWRNNTNTIVKKKKRSDKDADERHQGKGGAHHHHDKQKKVVPFCRLCNHHYGPKPRKHHAWCHKNEFYHVSGGAELVERIRQGRQFGCAACDKEFYTGRLNKKGHIRACVRNQTKLKEEAEERDRQEQEEERKEKRKTTRKRKETDSATTTKLKRGDDETKSGKKLRRSKSSISLKNSSRLATSDSSEEEGDISDCDDGPDDDGEDDDQSAYQPTNRRPIRALSVGKATTRKPGKATPTDHKERRKKKESVSTQATPTQNKGIGAGPLAKDGGSRPKTVVSLKSNWVNYQTNPWGPSGHVEGDVQLYGGATSMGGLGNYEALLPSNRYVTHPFESHSNYRSTHVTPEEGLALLRLTRDPIAARPWGFRVVRDEFGQACLIEGVDPLSPATSATFIGNAASSDTSSSGLCANDMIVAINGKVVGGMTEVGVELELALSGASLILVVSRYKHSEEVANKFASTERQILHVMDTAARDARLIGWLEVGNAKPPRESGGHDNATNHPESRSSLRGNEEEEEENLSFEEPNRTRRGSPPTTSRMLSSKKNSNVSNTSARFASDQAEGCDDDRAKASSRPVPPSLVQQHQAHPSMTSRGGERKDDDDSSRSSKNWDEDEDEDENAQLGCVCGKIHTKGSRNMFWIQCETCQSWFDVHKDCIGFTEHEAQSLANWNCEACPPSESPQEETSPASRPKSPGSEEVSPVDDVKQSSENGFIEARGCLGGASPVQQSGDDSRGSTRLVETPSTVAHDRVSAANTGNSYEVLRVAPLPKKQTESIRQRNRRDLHTSSTNNRCLLPESNPLRLIDGTFAQPQEEPEPVGMKWDEIRGLWTPKADEEPETSDKEQVTPSERAQDEDEGRGGPVDGAVSEEGGLLQGRNQSGSNLEARKTNEGFLRPKSLPFRQEDGSYSRPPGACPLGMKWDEHRCLWIPKIAGPETSDQEQDTSSVRALEEERDDIDGPVDGVSEGGLLPGRRNRTRRNPAARKTKEGFLRPKSIPFRREDGSYSRPPGPCPVSMKWDEHRGLWIPKTARKSGAKSREENGHSSEHSLSLRRHGRGVERAVSDAHEGEVFVLPRSKPKKLGDDSFARPPGPSPAEMEWDYNRGFWVVKGTSTTETLKHSGGFSDHISGSMFSISRPRRSRYLPAPSQTSEKDSDEPSEESGEVEVFSPGRRVNVQPHSWPGKNCRGGVAYVLKTFVDEDGDRFYNVKYVLGCSDKDIGAEYVRAHEFV